MVGQLLAEQPFVTELMGMVNDTSWGGAGTTADARKTVEGVKDLIGSKRTQVRNGGK
jgi:hypothetical protein